MKVYRIEAALKLGVGPTASSGQLRIHLDYYLVLTGRDESLVVTATPSRTPRPLPQGDRGDPSRRSRLARAAARPEAT